MREFKREGISKKIKRGRIKESLVKRTEDKGETKWERVSMLKE